MTSPGQPIQCWGCGLHGHIWSACPTKTSAQLAQKDDVPQEFMEDTLQYLLQKLIDMKLDLDDQGSTGTSSSDQTSDESTITDQSSTTHITDDQALSDLK